MKSAFFVPNSLLIIDEKLIWNTSDGRKVWARPTVCCELRLLISSAKLIQQGIYDFCTIYYENVELELTLDQHLELKMSASS